MAEKHPSRLDFGDTHPDAPQERLPHEVFQEMLSGAQLVNELEQGRRYPHDEDDTRSEWQRAKDHASDLNDEMIDERLRHRRVYIRYSQCNRKANDNSTEVTEEVGVREEYVSIYGFAPCYSDVQQKCGIGLRFYTSARSNFSAREVDVKDVITVPLSDPMLDVEFADVRLEGACKIARNALEICFNEDSSTGQGVDPNEQPLFPRDRGVEHALESLADCLQKNTTVNVRRVARLVSRIVNDPFYIARPDLQRDIESMLIRGFAPGRYKLTQNIAYELVPDSEEQTESNTRDLGNMYKKVCEKGCAQLDGSLIGVTILPKFSKNHKTLIPYFVLSSTDGNHIQLAPLENTSFIRRVGDST